MTFSTIDQGGLHVQTVSSYARHHHYFKWENNKKNKCTTKFEWTLSFHYIVISFAFGLQERLQQYFHMGPQLIHGFVALPNLIS